MKKKSLGFVLLLVIGLYRRQESPSANKIKGPTGKSREEYPARILYFPCDNYLNGKKPVLVGIGSYSVMR